MLIRKQEMLWLKVMQEDRNPAKPQVEFQTVQDPVHEGTELQLWPEHKNIHIQCVYAWCVFSVHSLFGHSRICVWLTHPLWRQSL